MASRDLNALTPELKLKATALINKCAVASIKIIITCTARLVKEQLAFYAQGRTPIALVNAMREHANLPSIPSSRNKKITWTLNSKHLIDLEDGSLENDKARAFDIAIIKDGKAVWDVKVSLNDNDIPDYEEVARIGESLGLTAGARFSSPDYVHFE